MPAAILGAPLCSSRSGPLFRPALASQRYRLVSEIIDLEEADLFIDAGCNVGNLLKTIVGLTASPQPLQRYSLRGPRAIIGLDMSLSALEESVAQLQPYAAVTLPLSLPPSPSGGDITTPSCSDSAEGEGNDHRDGADSSSFPAHTTSLSSNYSSASSSLRGAFVALLQCDLTKSLEAHRWPAAITDRIVEALAARLVEKTHRQRRQDATAAAFAASSSSPRYAREVTREDCDGQCTTTFSVMRPRAGDIADCSSSRVEYHAAATEVQSEEQRKQQHQQQQQPITLNIVVANIEVIEHIPPLAVEGFVEGVAARLTLGAALPWARKAAALAALMIVAEDADDDNGWDGAVYSETGAALDVIVNFSVVLTTPNGQMNLPIRNAKLSASSLPQEGDALVESHAEANAGASSCIAPSSSSSTSPLSFSSECEWSHQYCGLRHSDHYFELGTAPFGALADFMRDRVAHSLSSSTINSCTRDKRYPNDSGEVRMRRFANLGHISKLAPDDADADGAAGRSLAARKGDGGGNEDKHVSEATAYMCASHGVCLNFSISIAKAADRGVACESGDCAKECQCADGATVSGSLPPPPPFPFAAVFGSAVDAPPPLGDTLDWASAPTDAERYALRRQKAASASAGGDERIGMEEGPLSSKQQAEAIAAAGTGRAGVASKTAAACSIVPHYAFFTGTAASGRSVSAPERRYWDLLFATVCADTRQERERLHRAFSPHDFDGAYDGCGEEDIDRWGGGDGDEDELYNYLHARGDEEGEEGQPRGGAEGGPEGETDAAENTQAGEEEVLIAEEESLAGHFAELTRLVVRSAAGECYDDTASTLSLSPTSSLPLLSPPPPPTPSPRPRLFHERIAAALFHIGARSLGAEELVLGAPAYTVWCALRSLVVSEKGAEGEGGKGIECDDGEDSLSLEEGSASTVGQHVSRIAASLLAEYFPPPSREEGAESRGEGGGGYAFEEGVERYTPHTPPPIVAEASMRAWLAAARRPPPHLAAAADPLLFVTRMIDLALVGYI